MPAISNSSGLY